MGWLIIPILVVAGVVTMVMVDLIRGGLSREKENRRLFEGNTEGYEDE